MLIKFKCPDCDDSVMSFNEEDDSYVCSEADCQKELTNEDADALFESGDLVAIIEDDSEDDDDDDKKENPFAKKDKKASDDDDDDDEDDEDDDKEESFNGFDNRDTWTVNLIVQNEYKEFKAAVALMAEAEDKEIALEKYVTKKVAKNENFADVLEDVDYSDVNWAQVVEAMAETQTYFEDIKTDLVTALGITEGVDDDTKTQVVQVFEAALAVRYNALKGDLEEHYNIILQDAIKTEEAKLLAQMNDYLSEVVEEWMTENQIAIENGIKTEMTESFMDGLKDLFENHYIDVPEDRFDVLENLSNKIDELEQQIQESTDSQTDLQDKLNEVVKTKVVNKLSEGLADTQAEKLAEFAGSLDYESEEQFESTLKTLKESFLVSAKGKKDGDVVTGSVNEGRQDDEKDKVDSDNPIAIANAAMRRAIANNK